ncbi:hypothetical protein SLEP1_g18858 [Rubroshorea leprosula]|uniref:Uncharacterized protein n=1 Tax=Rubroshorea leprosula TaxID=152421 RepID=A0AAV5J9J2_9ROSI|nr:hypothetical protein SLEP1_g18858 [Rubroshorea leprosula]
MFDRIVVAGETAWTPAAGPIPLVQQNVGFEDAIDLEEGSGDSDEVNVIPTQTGGSFESYTTTTLSDSSKKNYEAYPDSTEECMEMLLTLPGVKDARVGKGQDNV